MTEAGASIGEVGARFMRVAWRALAALLVVGLVLEIALRVLGLQPQNLFRAGLSPTVLDRWTEWAMRPSVRVNEYAVTNAYGMHEDREVTLEKPPGMRRVGVLGSSVTWGLGESLENTIPRSAERALRRDGCAAEVLNFGSQGFNILNASAYLQVKMHQFHPDAVIVVMDLQMGLPRFPRPNPSSDEQAMIRRLGFFEELLKRASEYSVVLTAIDDVQWSRALFASRLPFPVEPKARPDARAAAPAPAEAGSKAFFGAWQWIGTRTAAFFEPFKAKEAMKAASVAPAKPAPDAPVERTAREYEARRERELGSLVAAASAFARQMDIALYFTTPYGPYFHATEEQLARFPLHVVAEAAPFYGGNAGAFRREAELQSEVITRAAQRNGARVIDMLPASREATMASGHFSNDGIHLSPQGYRHVGALIAERLKRDGLCNASMEKR